MKAHKENPGNRQNCLNFPNRQSRYHLWKPDAVAETVCRLVSDPLPDRIL